MDLSLYEKRTIAFIDILGFKKVLEKESKARDILEVLTQVKNKVEEHYLKPEHKIFQGIFDLEFSYFSDSIVISGSEHQTISVLFTALEFSQLLIEKGFLCRGAIKFGDIYHKQGIMFGNGFVEAYLNESNLAIYPRIIMDSDCVNLVNDSRNEESDFKDLVKIDDDGIFYLNLLYKVDNSEDIKNKLSIHVVDQSKDNSDSPKIMQKLNWLRNKYNL